MAVTSRAHVQTRLQNLFSSVHAETAEDSPLYTKQFEKDKQLSLVAIFDNGIDPDPAFSGSILGKLYLDEEQNLALATWPLSKDKSPPWRTEVLLPHVTSFAFEFLGKNSAPEDKKEEKIRSINANYAWRSHHPKSEGRVPSMIRLVVYEEKNKDPLQFAFILPFIEPHVSYRGKKV